MRTSYTCISVEKIHYGVWEAAFAPNDGSNDYLLLTMQNSEDFEGIEANKKYTITVKEEPIEVRKP